MIGEEKEQPKGLQGMQRMRIIGNDGSFTRRLRNPVTYSFMRGTMATVL
jgi:hypothetical protein